MTTETTNFKTNRVRDLAERSRTAKFSIARRSGCEELARRMGVESLPYEIKQQPRGKISRAYAAIDAFEPILAERILAVLDLERLVEPRGDESNRLIEHCQTAVAIEHRLKEILDEHNEWFAEIVQASIFLSVDAELQPPDLRGRTREEQGRMLDAFEKSKKKILEQQRRGRLDQAKLLAQELISKKLKLPRYETVGEPILSRKQLSENDVSVLSEVMKQRAAAKSTAVATRILGVFRSGLQAGIFFEVEGLGERAHSFRYCHHYILDALRSQSTKRDGGSLDTASHWRRSAKTIVVEQTLVLGKLYSHEAMLKNPALRIPSNYLALVKNAPSLLRDSVNGLFGTQVAETESTRSKSSQDIETRWRQRCVPDDPCLLFASTIAFAGWSDHHMSSIDAHQKIVNSQRKLLDKASRQAGRIWAYLVSALIAALVLAIQAVVLVTNESTLVAAVTCLPLALATIAFVGFAGLSAVRMRLIRRSEAAKTQASLAQLEELYPGIDASSPLLVDKEVMR